MSEIKKLENQIHQLQRELQRQNKEAARYRQKQEEENLKRLQEYRAEMKDQLKQHDKKVQKEYERLLQEYQRSTDEEMQEQQLKMDQEYQKLLLHIQQNEQEWMEKSRQLEALIADLKKNTQEKEQASAQEADRYTTEAALTYKEVEKKPHDKFFPKRITAFYQAIREARTLYQSGLHEAAIAISISARSGLNRLGYEVEDEFEKWKRQYFIFRNKVGLLHTKMIDELKTWKEFLGNPSDKVSDTEKDGLQKEVNFWAKGEYGKLSNRIAEFGREIARAEGMGMEAYLKDSSSISMDELKKGIQELDEMNMRFERMLVLYKARYLASCERADWGEEIIDFLVDEINLSWVEEESHFRQSDAAGNSLTDYLEYMEFRYGKEFEAVDIREWLELVFENGMGTRIYIYIVPYEKDTLVENRLVLYIDYNGAENMAYSREIYSHIRESISLEEDGVIHFAEDVDQLALHGNMALRETGRALAKKIGRA